jgi:polysaccharide pyruvyl transferase WcaK-like protein
VFVTGVCLQGNKGGPALALSLMDQLRRRLDGVSFVFSVPADEEYPYEVQWASRYGVDIVENFTLRDIVPPFCFRRFPSRLERFRRWVEELRSSALLLEMSAITYVGPPARRQSSVFLGGRLHYFLLAKLLGKPFLAWTQSFGPFSTTWIRFVARLDLSRQPVVFCRGADALASVKQLLPGKDARSFPDVAVSLPFDRSWGKKYLENLIGADASKPVVTISPSAVLHAKTRIETGSSEHVKKLSGVVRRLLQKGYQAVLVPHTFRSARHDPMLCDYAVSGLIADFLGAPTGLWLVEEDLSPVDLKSIISAAHIHIGGRYHSIVAALSSGVPCISLSWHPKYTDIMQMYGMENYVCESCHGGDPRSVVEVYERLESHRDDYHRRLLFAQDRVLKRLHENADLFVGLMKIYGA